MNALPSLISGLTALVALGAVVIDHGIHRRSSLFRDRSIYRGSADRLAVALTFDDGPGPQTLELLTYLESEQVRATFFQCGLQVERYPSITQAVYAAGHEIGNHSYSHLRLSPSIGRAWHIPTPRLMYKELALTQHLLTEVCGTTPGLFRPPYGKRWSGLDAVQRRLGLRGVLWTIIGHDWEWTADKIAEHVLARITPGAIICLHDGRDVNPIADISEMMKALRIIIPALKEKGFRFETVSEILLPNSEYMPVSAA